MISKLLNLKNTNKVLFWVLIPLVAFAFIIKILMELNILGAKRDLKKTEKETIDLGKEKEEAEAKAKEFLNQAEKHESKAAEHHKVADEAKARAEEKEAEKADVDYDWHLKE